MECPTLRQIRCFLELCRDFHFSQAAIRLGMAQPPFSRTIRELEETVGTTLFDRSGRRARLTAAGEVFLKSVYQVPAAMERAVIAAQRAARGEARLLRIGFVGAILGDQLPDVFERYRSAYPGTQLALEDLSPRALLERVASGALDGAFLGVRPNQLPPLLRCVNWRQEALHVCLSPRHPLWGRKRVSIDDIASEPLVTLSATSAPAYQDFIYALYRAAGYAPVMGQETNAVAAIMSLVIAGCGNALLPQSALRIGGARMEASPRLAPVVRLPEVFVHAEQAETATLEFAAFLADFRVAD